MIPLLLALSMVGWLVVRRGTWEELPLVQLFGTFGTWLACAGGGVSDSKGVQGRWGALGKLGSRCSAQRSGQPSVSPAQYIGESRPRHA